MAAVHRPPSASDLHHNAREAAEAIRHSGDAVGFMASFSLWVADGFASLCSAAVQGGDDFDFRSWERQALFQARLCICVQNVVFLIARLRHPTKTMHCPVDHQSDTTILSDKEQISSLSTLLQQKEASISACNNEVFA